jgi:homoserine O-succinyltransferase/O-acetyltransferase
LGSFEMPLFMPQAQIPAHAAAQKYCRPLNPDALNEQSGRLLRLALVNNMPDSALEDTEAQFFGLLAGAATDISVQLELFSLPDVPRGEKAQQHLARFYKNTNFLLRDSFDGVIITGTEPRESDLRKEPYWDSLETVLDWAEEHTTSTVLSCLAAHAGVLHRNAIARQPMNDKRFGVFEHEIVAEHALTAGVGNPVSIPHSRWNELSEYALISAGYRVLTKSPDDSVDLFIKQKNTHLSVHFQGHPEYGELTLFKEYRRDVRRFLRRERETYPVAPRAYFGAAATKLADDFRATAISQRSEQILEKFPEVELIATLKNSWQASSVRIYHNWLQLLLSGKANPHPATAMASVRRG